MIILDEPEVKSAGVQSE